jgi:hypothetical protein
MVVLVLVGIALRCIALGCANFAVMLIECLCLAGYNGDKRITPSFVVSAFVRMKNPSDKHRANVAKAISVSLTESGPPSTHPMPYNNPI